MVRAQDPVDSGDITIENESIRVRFRKGTPQFGLFPRGYTGFVVELRKGDSWTVVAESPYFSAYAYRSGWGRDWLHYVVPPSVRVTQEADRALVVFTDSHTDLDRVPWHFEFAFELRQGSPVVYASYTARVEAPREVLLFQGPRLHVGEGSFGARKDEALFPGLEYLQGDERSSAMEALAPDARLHFAPHPARITIPLMAVVCDGAAVGLLWDPQQPYHGEDRGPGAVFASPNWIEDKPNHLCGLFAPGIPDYVPENGLRAHTPLSLEAGGSVNVQGGLFAIPAAHATDAVDLWLRLRGGLPTPTAPPRPLRAYVNESVRLLTDDIWNEDAKGWAWTYGDEQGPHVAVAAALARALPLVDDPALADRVKARIREVMPNSTYLPLALRGGDLLRALAVQRDLTRGLIDTQQPDGSWGYVQTEIGEGGLAGLMGPPVPGAIAPEGARSQGITAMKAADLLGYALLSGDEEALAHGLLAVEDLNRYVIPYVYENNECPPSPSLHGSYAGLRACLTAYRITGREDFLRHAAYWAKTGLPFVYLWSYGPKTVPYGQVHTGERIFVDGSRLYEDPVRDPMLYGALFGYGSSQFMHHWYGLLVHWIGLKYAVDLADLAPYEDSLPWTSVATGLIRSGMWQAFDKPPFSGYFPDAFSVERWVPSGPAFSPAALLDAMLTVEFGLPDYATVIVRDGARRYHITATAAVHDAGIREGVLTFEADDPVCRDLAVVVSGLAEDVSVRVDGAPLAAMSALEADAEGYARTPDGLTVVKVHRTDTPRRIEITTAPALQRASE